MKFEQKYSSSDGNLYLVTSAHGRFLIECGVSYKNLIAALDFDLSDIGFCLLTHSHRDHYHCFEKLAGMGILIYATKKTFDVLPLVDRPRMLKTIIFDQQFIVEFFKVTPFETYHDLAGSCGFVIEQGDDAILFAIDTATIKEDWRESDIKFTTIAIECSWNRGRIEAGLEAGKLHPFYTNRLKTTHMEDVETMRYLREYCDLSKCREIHLLHLSPTMDKDALQKEFEDEFMLPIIIKT